MNKNAFQWDAWPPDGGVCPVGGCTLPLRRQNS